MHSSITGRPPGQFAFRLYDLTRIVREAFSAGSMLRGELTVILAAA
jgi:hypothetical protein